VRREWKEVYCSEEGRVFGVSGDGQVEVIWMVVVGSWIFVPIVCLAGEEDRRVWRAGIVGVVDKVVGLMVVIVMVGIVADIGRMRLK
jgi:hypothetical protein